MKRLILFIVMPAMACNLLFAAHPCPSIVRVRVVDEQGKPSNMQWS